jgi:hypothetical protein
MGPPSHRRAPSPNPTSPATTSSAINRSALFLLECAGTVSIVRDLKGPEPPEGKRPHRPLRLRRKKAGEQRPGPAHPNNIKGL